MSANGNRIPTAAARDTTSGVIPAWITRPAVVVPIILAAVFAMYAPSLRSWFLTDDMYLLRAARIVSFRTYVLEAFDYRDFEPLHFYAYRPLYFISTDVLHQVFGMHPLPYHLVVLGFHLLNVVLTFHIARKLTGSAAIGYGAAAIFGLHPVYTVTVAWISGLNSVVAATAQLSCVAALLEYDRRHRPTWLAAALIAYALGLLFHQEIFIAPAVVLLYLLFRRPDWHDRLRSPAALLPFALFGIVLLAFLAVQGQTSENAGLADRFVPSRGLPWLVLGTVALSVAPTGGAGFAPAHGLVAALLVALVVFALVRAPDLRGALLFAVAWYAGSMALAVLFYDGFPTSIMQSLIGRKIYTAGPAMGLALSICLAVCWREATRRLQVPVASAAVALIVVAVTAAYWRAHEKQQEMAAQATQTQQFHRALTAMLPTIPDGGQLYVAGAPEALVIYVCEQDSPQAASATFDPRTLCFLYSMVDAVYGRQVHTVLIMPWEARDPAFLASLGVDDRVFCHRC